MRHTLPSKLEVSQANCGTENSTDYLVVYLLTSFFGFTRLVSRHYRRHAGGRCSKALTQILAQTVSREPDFSLELKSAVHKGFLRANAEFLRKAERFSANDGTTEEFRMYCALDHITQWERSPQLGIRITSTTLPCTWQAGIMFDATIDGAMTSYEAPTKP